jgi:hypothetical protein
MRHKHRVRAGLGVTTRVLGTAALVGMGYIVARVLPDLPRYLRMKLM